MTALDPIPFRVAALEQQIAELRAEIAALKAEQQPTDRNAYMRDYMRQRRAALKNKNTVSQ
jgi:cell division protein FtsB